MQINLIPDSSVSSAPAGFTAAIQAAAEVFEQDFSGNYTVNIDYGWGTMYNQPNPALTTIGSGVFSFGSPQLYENISYVTVKSWLTAHATLPDQIAAVASLPASYTAFPGDANAFLVSTAQEKALGVLAGSTGTVDGAIGFNTVVASGPTSWESGALVEIMHALGWYTYSDAGAPTIADLFRYSSPGNYEWTGGQPAYFSVDGGATDLANFVTSGDWTLLKNVAPNEPLGAMLNAQSLTSLDIEILNDIGFGERNSAPPPAVVHQNNLALSGDVTGPYNFIDLLNLQASYSDLIHAFGTNTQAMQNWFNNSEPSEHRADTFDGLDYIASYGDLIRDFKSAGSEKALLDDGASHFIQVGFDEGRTTTFNGLDYIASYGDLIKAFGANGDAGAYHYIEAGVNEGRATTFDGLDYIASYSDLIKAFGANEQAGASHFITNGSAEGRTTTFDGLDYVASYSDLIKAFGANNDAGAAHFITNGSAEGRKTTFDGLDYIASYSDLIKAFGANNDAGAAHFITNGSAEGRKTTFDGLAYIAQYTDLMQAFGANNDAGASHYITNGHNEGRTTAFNVAAYESAHPDLIGKYASNDAFLTAYIDTYHTTGHLLT